MIRATISIILVTLFATAVQADQMHRTISVDGHAFVAVKPDMARVNIAVEERNASLAVAQDAVADVTAQVMSLLGDLDIEDRHIDTTGATVQPDYRWNRQTEEQELVGYIVRRRIDIEVRDLDILGQLIDGAVGAGVNQVSPPVLDTSQRRKYYRDALGKAVQDARSSAEVLAGSADVDLGDVLQINAASRPPPPMPVMARSGAMMEMGVASADVAGANYNPGDLRLEANVVVVFEIDE